MTQPVRVEFWTYDLLLAKLGSNMQIFGLFCCQTAVFTYVSLFNNELVRSSRKRRTLPSPLFNRFWQVKPMTQYCLIRSPQKPARRPWPAAGYQKQQRPFMDLKKAAGAACPITMCLNYFLLQAKYAGHHCQSMAGAAFEGILEEKYLMLPLLRPYYLLTFTK